MATSISYLQLDSNYDPIFADGTSLTGAAAVAQVVLTRLNLFFGEWWENLTLGLPVFQSMLGQLASPQGLSAMQLAVSQNVSGAPFVTSVTGVVAKFKGGILTVTVNYTSSFGPGSITTTLQGG